MMSEPPNEPDVEIGASASARELTFNELPQTRVESFAEPSGQSGSASSRRNLPDQVQTDVTYQNIEADFKSAAKLADMGISQQPDSESGESQPPDGRDE
jgi:hypothetical protein